MPLNLSEEVGDTDDHELCRGIKVTRPYSGAVWTARRLGWILMIAGTAEVIIGALLFRAWKYVGCFWVGALAWMTGLMGTFVSASKNSGGPATALLLLLAALSVTASTLSIFLIDGLAYFQVHTSEGNCYNGSTCPDIVCDSDQCVCWAPDNSTTDCSVEGNSTKYCLAYNSGEGCDELGGSETLLFTSSVILVAIDVLSFLELSIGLAMICCCKYTLTLKRSNGIDSFVRSVGG